MGEFPFRCRIAAVAATLTMAVALAGIPGVAPIAPVAAASCVDGYRLVQATQVLAPEAVADLATDKALLAGGARLSGGRRSAVIAARSGSGIKRLASFPVGNDSAFMGLDGAPGKSLWAVGYSRTWTSVSPLAARKKPGGAWSLVKLPSPGAAGAALADVATVGGDRTWAVGFRVTTPGQRWPWVVKRSGGKWENKSPRLAWNERGQLAGVSASAKGGTWVVGWSSRFGRVNPYMARRTSGGWQRISLPPVGDGALADIDVDWPKSGWAVGYRFTSSGMRPLVLRWDGSTWTRVEGPYTGPGAAALTGLSVDDGVLTVVGTAWADDARRFRALVATYDGSSWKKSVLKSMPGDAMLSAVDGNPKTSGWGAGANSYLDGVVVRTCEAPAAPATARNVRSQRAADLGTAASGGELPEATDTLPPHAVGLAAAPKLQVSPASEVGIAAGLTVRDRARASGLPTSSYTWGAVIEDFDDDGRRDIFLGMHGKGFLYLDKGSTYVDVGIRFGKGDRHGCAAADVDGSGLPDLYCSFGAARGTGIKSNQLWIDPGTGAYELHPLAGGAPEPFGRGRKVVFIDADGDGGRDLFLGHKPGRVDGLPSPNRLYRQTAAAEFELARASGVAPDLGTYALDVSDVDRDGRTDLLLVYYDERAKAPKSGTRLYRSTASGFKDVTGSYGIARLGEVDADLAKLDNDKRPDLVQLSGNRIRVSLQRNGRFVKVYERAVSKGVAVATGDVDRDGDRDIFVLRQKSGAINDLLLLNTGGGRSFRAISMPSRPGGAADDVYPIDHDQNGTTDFLALNGRGEFKGPVQLFAFYK